MSMEMRYIHEDYTGTVSPWMAQETTLIGIAALCISLPILTLLAEVVIGRYKLVSCSLKAMWLLSVVASIISIFKENLSETLYTIQLFLLLVPQYFILGAFVASTIPLGLDQINGCSDRNICAFIQWSLWAYFSGEAISTIIDSNFNNIFIRSQQSEVMKVMSLLPVLLMSVGLVLDCCFHHKLIKEPVSANPVSLIFKVLKYAAKHKYPVQRSAFTYCKNEQPTRLDYCKSKYGGPFTTEQVEDVKTFWRMLVVILVISTTHISLMAQFESISVVEDLSHDYICCNGAFAYPSSAIMYFIPLYEPRHATHDN